MGLGFWTDRINLHNSPKCILGHLIYGRQEISRSTYVAIMVSPSDAAQRHKAHRISQNRYGQTLLWWSQQLLVFASSVSHQLVLEYTYGLSPLRVLWPIGRDVQVWRFIISVMPVVCGSCLILLATDYRCVCTMSHLY